MPTDYYLTHFSSSFYLYLRDNILDQNTLLLFLKKKTKNSIINLARSKLVNGFTYQVQTHKHLLYANKNLWQAISEKQLQVKLI